MTTLSSLSRRAPIGPLPRVVATIAVLIIFGYLGYLSLSKTPQGPITSQPPVLEYTDQAGQTIHVNLSVSRKPGDTIPFPRSGKLSLPIPDTNRTSGYRRLFVSWTSDGLSTCHYKYGTEDISETGVKRPHRSFEIYAPEPCSPKNIDKLIRSEGYREPGLNSLWMELLDLLAWFID